MSIDEVSDKQAALSQKDKPEYQGQVAGAFCKEGLGEIDVVWGKITNAETHEGYGLSHFLDKRKSEF